MRAAVYRGDCSGCGEEFTLDLEGCRVLMTRPSNGLRGSLHRPAEVLTVDADLDGPLLMWDCPLCGYAESEEV